MIKIYLVSGYDSWNNKFVCLAVKEKIEADRLKAGLHNGDITLIGAKNMIKAINKCMALSDELKNWID